MTTILWEGTGVLGWSRHERVTDRYGTVALNTDPWPGGRGYQQLAGIPVGVEASIVVTVTEQRQSGHVGDLFRGLFPPEGGTPVGTRFVLGTGVLFVEEEESGHVVGVRPDDGRASDWLDPTLLYQVHDQTVRLTIEQED